MNKVVYILRSVPGAGKSTLAEHLCDTSKSSHICCADDYFMVDGEYKWDVEKLGSAHAWCMQSFIECLKDNVDVIVVANTNTYEKDVKSYYEKAKEYGYTVFSLVVENRHDGKNVHDVSDEILATMENRLKQNIKLR